jgi:molybdate transport repressor ModE-like protein
MDNTPLADTLQQYIDAEGRLSCRDAMTVAQEQGVSLSAIASIVASANIRIGACALGQFGASEEGAFDETAWQTLSPHVHQDKIQCTDAMAAARQHGFDAVRGTLLQSGTEVTYCALGCFRERRKTKLYLKTKNWIENRDEELVLSKGKIDILELIDQHGSIAKAARIMGMSYKKAWTHIKVLQENLEDEILETRKGAGKESGTRLTPIAREFIDNYRHLHRKIEAYADEQFKQLFLTARSRRGVDTEST